jgi:hypothetical protein
LAERVFVKSVRGFSVAYWSFAARPVSGKKKARVRALGPAGKEVREGREGKRREEEAKGKRERGRGKGGREGKGRKWKRRCRMRRSMDKCPRTPFWNLGEIREEREPFFPAFFFPT